MNRLQAVLQLDQRQGKDYKATAWTNLVFNKHRMSNMSTGGFKKDLNCRTQY